MVLVEKDKNWENWNKFESIVKLWSLSWSWMIWRDSISGKNIYEYKISSSGIVRCWLLWRIKQQNERDETFSFNFHRQQEKKENKTSETSWTILYKIFCWLKRCHIEAFLTKKKKYYSSLFQLSTTRAIDNFTSTKVEWEWFKMDIILCCQNMLTVDCMFVIVMKTLEKVTKCVPIMPL